MPVGGPVGVRTGPVLSPGAGPLFGSATLNVGAQEQSAAVVGAREGTVSKALKAFSHAPSWGGTDGHRKAGTAAGTALPGHGATPQPVGDAAANALFALMMSSDGGVGGKEVDSRGGGAGGAGQQQHSSGKRTAIGTWVPHSTNCGLRGVSSTPSSPLPSAASSPHHH
jgi:hypothetical protein|eukprot:COSAG01_NODE_1834_length_9105_cov_35.595603_11_plen_168_part_00